MTRLYIQSRNGSAIPDSAKDSWSQITFEGNTMVVNGKLYRGSSKAEAEKSSQGRQSLSGINTFEVSDLCKFTVSPTLENASAGPQSTDYEGFKKGLYNSAMDNRDAIVTFHVENGKVVEATQWTQLTG